MEACPNWGEDCDTKVINLASGNFRNVEIFESQKNIFPKRKKRRHIKRWTPEHVGVSLERENSGLSRVGVTGGGENFPKKQLFFFDF